MELIPFKHKKYGYAFGEPYFNILKDIEFDFIPEDKLFYGKEYYMEKDLEDYQIEEVLPLEVEFELKGDDKILFSEPVVIDIRDFDRE